jgi:hypothetical protein
MGRARSATVARMDPADARYPAVPAAKGHYESWYLKAGDAVARQAVWLRYTIHKRPGEAPVGSLWITLFDGDGPHAAKVSLPAGELRPAIGGGVRIGDSAIGDAGASGTVPELAAWDLRFAPTDPTQPAAGEPFPYLPRPWMYTAPLPRTKALSLLPAIRVSGELAVRGRTVSLNGWPGMVGHNWGAEHAERWIWLHGTAFEEQPTAWIDAIVGRIQVGPWTTPWIANGCLSLDGVRHRLGGINRTRATKIDERPERAAFTFPGAGLTVHGEVGAPREDVVGWVYADPAGPEHHTAHCAIADMTLHVAASAGSDARPCTLTVRGGATYELGMRERDHGIPIQPFSDP